jgi:hypothetical protein
LLTIPSFRQDVQGVSVFIASHHDRESGCCTELFELLRPQLVIISDDGRQYDSQDTDYWYRTRCTGAVFVTNERRYVAQPARTVRCLSTSQWTGAGPSSKLRFATGRGQLHRPGRSLTFVRSPHSASAGTRLPPVWAAFSRLRRRVQSSAC